MSIELARRVRQPGLGRRDSRTLGDDFALTAHEPGCGRHRPHDLDRRVPIVFWWPGAPAQTRMLPVATTDIAPTLANIIGITAPADLDGRCLDIGDFGGGRGGCR